ELVHGASRALGRQIPECAIERVARRARRHGRLQGLAIETAGDVRAHRLDRRRHALDRLTVARVGHAFAPPAVGSVREFRHHDHPLGLGAAADGEGAGDRPALDTHGKGEGVHWRRIIRYRDMLFRPQSKWRASVWTMRSAKNHTAVYAAIAFCIIAAAGAT